MSRPVTSPPTRPTRQGATASPDACRRAGRLAAAFVACWGAVSAVMAENWTVVGQQGLVHVVIVPLDRARDRDAYRRQIERLCGPVGSTCFVNFYTNPTGAPVVLPLPDAIAGEAAAMYRRSGKRGAEVFTWSCRLQPGSDGCF